MSPHKQKQNTDYPYNVPTKGSLWEKILRLKNVTVTTNRELFVYLTDNRYGRQTFVITAREYMVLGYFNYWFCMLPPLVDNHRPINTKVLYQYKRIMSKKIYISSHHT